MTEDKVSYRLMFLMLGCFVLGASLTYGIMEKIMQINSIENFAYRCDIRFGEGGYQLKRISYSTYECVPKIAPEINITKEAYDCLKYRKCKPVLSNATTIP